ncbi:hypothetical protein [Streptomyces turgidiscabies]|uniref:hypothetical protein n=1 Tax=Streptomyces turgidiscabies TaxID=85558 RepID=UPI0038F79EA4
MRPFVDLARAKLPAEEHDTVDNATVLVAELPFSVPDIARLLGGRWSAESGRLSGPRAAKFTFLVDVEGDLVIEFWGFTDDLSEDAELPKGVLDCDAGVYLEGACAGDGLDAFAELAAAAIRTVTGNDTQPPHCAVLRAYLLNALHAAGWAAVKDSDSASDYGELSFGTGGGVIQVTASGAHESELAYPPAEHAGWHAVCYPDGYAGDLPGDAFYPAGIPDLAEDTARLITAIRAAITQPTNNVGPADRKAGRGGDGTSRLSAGAMVVLGAAVGRGRVRLRGSAGTRPAWRRSPYARRAGTASRREHLMDIRPSSRPHPHTLFDQVRAGAAQVLTEAGYAPYRSQDGAITETGFETLPTSTWPSIHVRVMHCQIPDGEEAAVLERLAETDIPAYNRYVDEWNAQRNELGRELADGYQRSLEAAGWTTRRKGSGSLLVTPSPEILAAIPPRPERVEEFTYFWQSRPGRRSAGNQP